MTKVFFFLINSLTCLSIIGQGVSFEFNQTINKTPDQTIEKLFEIDSLNYVIKRIEDNKTDFILDILDGHYNFLSSTSYSLPLTKIKDFTVLNGQLVVLGVHYEKGQDKFKAFIIKNDQSISEKTLMTLTANGGYHSLFDFSASPNSNYFSIIGSHAYQEKHKEIIRTALFDSLQFEIYSNEILTSIESSKRRHNVLICNNNGFSYIVKKNRLKSKNSYYIYTSSKTGASEHADLRLKARQIVDVEYTLDSNGTLFLGGFYSSPITFNFEGMFIAKYSEKAHSEFVKEYIFNTNVIEAFKSKKEIKEYGYGLDFFSGGSMCFTDDKNIILTAQHHSVIRDAKNGPEDYRRGFVVINFDINGGFKYSAPISTNQTDGKSVGYWSGIQQINFLGQPLFLLNRIGEGAKEAKGVDQPNSGLPIEVIRFSSSGNYESTYPSFETDVLNYALNTHIKNETSKSLVCFESLDGKGYTFGIIKSSDE